jgi:putative hydrolase of the HAD superfamily
MSPSTPKFIYFDLGNVIIHFDHDRMCRQIGTVCGLEPQQVRQVIFESPMLRRIEIGELTNEAWYKEFCRATGTQPPWEDLLLATNDIFWPNLEIIPVISQLAAAGWPLGILSNTSQAHWEFLADGRYGILPTLFDQIIVSYDARALKPGPEIFAIAADKANCRPQEVFYTDDREDNVEGARKAGFDAEVFTHVPLLVQQLRRRGVRLNY